MRKELAARVHGCRWADTSVLSRDWGGWIPAALLTAVETMSTPETNLVFRPSVCDSCQIVRKEECDKIALDTMRYATR